MLKHIISVVVLLCGVLPSWATAQYRFPNKVIIESAAVDALTVAGSTILNGPTNVVITSLPNTFASWEIINNTAGANSGAGFALRNDVVAQAALQLGSSTTTSALGLGPNVTRLIATGTGGLNVYSNNQIGFWVGGVEGARFSAAGEMGIGTTAPGARLDLGATARNDLLFLYNDGSGKIGGGVALAEYRQFTCASCVMTFGELSSGEAFTERWRMDAGGHFVPAIDGTVDIGSATKRLNSVITDEGLDVVAGGNTASYGINGADAQISAGGATYFLGSGGLAASHPFNAQVVSTYGLNINRSISDGDLVQFQQASTTEGSISVSGTTVSYNAFMGSHYTQLRKGQREPAVGTVMVSSGRTIASRDGTRHGEKFVYVDRSTKRNQKGVYGVWFASLNKTAAEMSWGDPDGDVYTVAGLGLFKVLVTDTCGNIEVGDLLASSPLEGLAERQCFPDGSNYDDLVRDTTLGKALVKVDWSKITPNKQGVRRALVPAILYAG